MESACLELDMELAMALAFGADDNEFVEADPTPDVDFDRAVAMSLQQEDGNVQVNNIQDREMADDSKQNFNGDEQEKTETTRQQLATPDAVGIASRDSTSAESDKSDDNDMVASSLYSTERAWNFVRAIIKEYESLIVSQEINKGTASTLQFETIGTDDMIMTVEAMMETQENFQLVDNKDTKVDIGYHYTQSRNVEQIKNNGLLTKADRDNLGVANNYNGSVWGDGIYTANNPFAYTSYGDVGILVARLKGTTNPAKRQGLGFVGDTGIMSAKAFGEMVILRTSLQCAPLMRFKKPIRPDTNTDNAIWYVHRRLQGIVDAFFNCGMKTDVVTVERPKPTPRVRRRPAVRPGVTNSIPHFAKNGTALTQEEGSAIAKRRGQCEKCGRQTHTITVFKRMPLTNQFVNKGVCISCNPSSKDSVSSNTNPALPPQGSPRMDSANNNQRKEKCELCGKNGRIMMGMFVLDASKNQYSNKQICIQCKNSPSKSKTYQDQSLCVSRRTWVSSEPVRGQPSSPCHSEFLKRFKVTTTSKNESMRISRYSKEKLSCGGCDTFVAVYAFNVNPGTNMSVCTRAGYFPDKPESRAVLERLKYAFCAGFLDLATWPLVPHRASPYVLPNKNILEDCSRALDRWNIPPAEECSRVQAFKASFSKKELDKGGAVPSMRTNEDSSSAKELAHSAPTLPKTYSALTEEERNKVARGMGVCAECGIVTQATTVFAKVNDKLVHQGICIGCNPTRVPPRIRQEYFARMCETSATEKPATNTTDSEHETMETTITVGEVLVASKKTESVESEDHKGLHDAASVESSSSAMSISEASSASAMSVSEASLVSSMPVPMKEIGG